jgi:predicted AAA+ superfamily ATPase
MNGGIPQEPAGSNGDVSREETENNTETFRGARKTGEQKRSREASAHRQSKALENIPSELEQRMDVGVSGFRGTLDMLRNKYTNKQHWIHRGRKTKSGWIFTVISEALLRVKNTRLKREQKQQLAELEMNLKSLVRQLANSPPIQQPAEDIRQALTMLNRLRGLVFYADILADKYVASFIAALRGLISSSLLLTMDVESLEPANPKESASYAHDEGIPQTSNSTPRAKKRAPLRRRGRSTTRPDDPKRQALIKQMDDQLIEEILGSPDSGDGTWVAPLESAWASAPWKAPFVQFYRDLSELFIKHGQTWEGHILDLTLYSSNAFTESMQQRQVSENVSETTDTDLASDSGDRESLDASGADPHHSGAGESAVHGDVFRRSMSTMVRQDLDVLQELCSWSPQRLARCIAFSIMGLSEADLEHWSQHQADQPKQLSGLPTRESIIRDNAEMLVTLLARESPSTGMQLENGLVAQRPMPLAIVADSIERSLRSLLFKSSLTASVTEPKLRRWWSQYFSLIAKRIQLRGDGILGQYYMLYFSNHDQSFKPVESPDLVRLEDIVGYDEIKQKFVQNIKFFLAGHPAHHVLLMGACGTGKSALVKAVANEFYGAGLRLVQLDSGYFGAAQGLGTIPIIQVKGGKVSRRLTEEDIPLGALGFIHDVQGLARQACMHPNLRFLLFLDDVILNDEDPRLVALRGVLSGGLLALPKNLILVATCNPGALAPDLLPVNVATDASDSAQLRRSRSRRRLRILSSVDFYDVFSDLPDDTVAFVDRFGMVLTFDKPSKSMYLEFVRNALERYGDSARRIPWDALRKRALAYARTRCSYSARTARHFISSVEDEQRFMRAGAPLVPSADALALMKISDPDRDDDDDDDEDEDEDEDDEDYLDDVDFDDDDDG